MHIHAPIHPFRKPPAVPLAYLGNLALILLGILAAMLMGPLRLD